MQGYKVGHMLANREQKQDKGRGRAPEYTQALRANGGFKSDYSSMLKSVRPLTSANDIIIVNFPLLFALQRRREGKGGMNIIIMIRLTASTHAI